MASVTAGLPAVAQDSGFSGRPIRIVLGAPAGGAADAVVRIVAEQLRTNLKQTVVVDNRPGGLFGLALQATTSARADGHTLMYVHLGMLAVQSATRRFDLLKDLIPITKAGETGTVIATSGKGPFKTLRELIDFGRAHPGQLNYATSGPGSAEHLKSVEIGLAAGFKATHVPYKGGPEMALSVMQEETHFTVLPAILAGPHVATGQMRLLAAVDSRRLPAFPDVPTTQEAGVAVKPLTFWGGFAAPAGTPAPVVERLHREIVAAMRTPFVQEKLGALGSNPIYNQSPAEFSRQIEADLGWMEPAVKAAGLQIN